MEENDITESWGIALHKLHWKTVYTSVIILLLLPILFRRIYNTHFVVDSYASADTPPALVPEDTYTYGAWEDGDVYYVGKQKQGKLEGYGSQWDEDQFFFGNHTSGKRNGYGLLKVKDGSSWMGRYDNGTMCEGMLIYEDGSWEMTDQSAGIIESSDLKTIRYDYGDYYYGEVDDGKPEGYGQYYSPVQEYFYLGEFQNGKRSGTGVLYTITSPEDISMMTGTWNDGLFSGKGVWAQNPEMGFEEGEWHYDESTSYVSQLVDGSWYYRNALKSSGLHIICQPDGDWYYYDMGR